jgi:putative addiction module component (TIGR02574 family)
MGDLNCQVDGGALPETEAPSPEIEAAWDREIARRIAAYERGESKTYPADEVFAEARRMLDERL